MELDECHLASSRAELELADSAFPSIAEYGFLSDCEVTALVAPSGSVEWMCLPRMDGPPSVHCRGADVEPPRTHAEAHAALVRTANHWHEWLGRGTFPDHPWRPYLERSPLTLKGLTYAPAGALTAAAPTSLPETFNGDRNWDYRYTWVRSTFTLLALHTLGYLWEANDFFNFLAERGIEDPEVQIMFGIGGERELSEQLLGHLSGLPVRGRSAWETGPGISASTTSGVRCSTRCICTSQPGQH